MSFRDLQGCRIYLVSHFCNSWTRWPPMSKWCRTPWCSASWARLVNITLQTTRSTTFTRSWSYSIFNMHCRMLLSRCCHWPHFSCHWSCPRSEPSFWSWSASTVISMLPLHSTLRWRWDWSIVWKICPRNPCQCNTFTCSFPDFTITLSFLNLLSYTKYMSFVCGRQHMVIHDFKKYILY